MTRIKLDYVHQFVDRHGRVRRYFRRPGYKRIPLSGAPGSDEFMTAYQMALAGQERVEIGASRTKSGTVAAAVVGYFNSMAFQSLAAETRRNRKSILEKFRAEHGDKRIALLQRNHIDKMASAKAGTPEMARSFLVAIRVLMHHCIAQGMRGDDPTQGIKSAKVKTDGYRAWTEPDIAAFEAAHPIGSRKRLALALLLYTAQRRGDVIRMGRQHLSNDAIHVRQQKTGVVLQIPVRPELRAALDATPSDNLTFLVTDFGKPFSPQGFSNWFREACNEAGLPKGLSAHGLRKAAARRLAEAGCTAHEIAAITGHASLQEVARYTKAADQARMARAAMDKAFPTETRTSIGKPRR
jgi:integrase